VRVESATYRGLVNHQPPSDVLKTTGKLGGPRCAPLTTRTTAVMLLYGHRLLAVPVTFSPPRPRPLEAGGSSVPVWTGWIPASTVSLSTGRQGRHRLTSTSEVRLFSG